MINRLLRVFNNPRKIGAKFMRITSSLWKSDSLYLQLLFYFRMGYKLDLNNPKTYSEKLQWLKIHDKNSFYTQLVDKLAVKDYISKIIGPQYLIKTIGSGWERAEQINWDTLPNRFVLKTTHGGGNTGVIICRDKSNFDKNYAIKLLNDSLDSDLYHISREWCYKNVKRQIIAEEYMEDEFGELRDYKFFCFDGVVKALFIATDRGNPNEPTKFDYFDRNFTHLNIINGHPMSIKPIDKPKNLDEMIRIAEKLSKKLPHVRVDLYDVNGRIYFGELTFYHHSGLCPMEPIEWDYRFGEWLKLPESQNGN